MVRGSGVNILPEGVVAVDVGDYDYSQIDYGLDCASNDTLTGEVTAQGIYNGVQYYTTASGLTTTGPASPYEFTYQTGCPTHVFQSPINIGHGEHVNMFSFFDLSYIATLEKDRPGNRCTSEVESEVKMCFGSPRIATTITEGPHFIERYRIDKDPQTQDGCYGVFGLMLDGDNKPFYGYLRGYHKESISCNGGAIAGGGGILVEQNQDGTIRWTDGTNFEDSTAKNEYLNFKRENHTGNGTIYFGDQQVGGAYSATKLTSTP